MANDLSAARQLKLTRVAPQFIVGWNDVQKVMTDSDDDAKSLIQKMTCLRIHCNKLTHKHQPIKLVSLVQISRPSLVSSRHSSLLNAGHNISLYKARCESEMHLVIMMVR